MTCRAKDHAYSEEEILKLGEYAGLKILRAPFDDRGAWDVVFIKELS